MPPRRKSTDQIRRRPSGAVKTEEKVITPQERRRSFLIQAGVWFLVIAFCMTSGIMCFSIGGQEKQVAEQQAAEQADPVQAEIDRWTNLVSSNPSDAVALANLGYYWTQKADTLPADGTADEGKEDEKDGKPAVSRDQALSNAEEYLNRAIKADPNYSFAIQKLAELRILQNKNDEAKSLYEQVITLTDQPIADDEDKETIEAQRTNQRCQARMGLAALYMLEKNFDAACGEIDKVLAEQPGSMEAFMLKANALAAKEDTPAMLQCCDEAIKVAESMKDLMNLVSFRVRKSKAYQEMNDKESARRELEEAKKYVDGINPQLSAGISAMINELDGKKPGEAKEAVKTEEDKAAADNQPAENAEENASQPEAQPSDNNEQPAPEANNESAPEPPADQPAPEEGK